MGLVRIPEDKYDNYRLDAMFVCYKWEPQFYDSNTLAKYVIVLIKEENEEVVRLTEVLDKEIRMAEEYLNKHLEIEKKLALPKRY